eukprot:jgi/Chlat1/5775/Chrsp387S05516
MAAVETVKLIRSFTETELGEVRFPEISTPILEKVTEEDFPEFHIEPEIALELLMAANFLDS